MKKTIILLILCALAMISFSQTTTNDNLKLDDLNKRVITLEQNISNASIEFKKYEKEVELSKAMLIMGGSFCLFGTVLLCEELKSDNQDFKMTNVMYCISGTFIITSLVFSYKAHNRIGSAGFQLGIGLDKIHLKYTF